MAVRWRKKYQWRISWPGEGLEIWNAYDGEVYVGRIMRDLTTAGRIGWFKWSGGIMGSKLSESLLPNQGWELTHWRAAKEVEDWYDRLREVNGFPTASAD